jgi:hypothetical protein
LGERGRIVFLSRVEVVDDGDAVGSRAKTGDRVAPVRAGLREADAARLRHPVRAIRGKQDHRVPGRGIAAGIEHGSGDLARLRRQLRFAALDVGAGFELQIDIRPVLLPEPRGREHPAVRKPAERDAITRRHDR